MHITEVLKVNGGEIGISTLPITPTTKDLNEVGENINRLKYLERGNNE